MDIIDILVALIVSRIGNKRNDFVRFYLRMVNTNAMAAFGHAIFDHERYD